MFLIRFLIVFVLLPTTLIIASQLASPVGRLWITYALFPVGLLLWVGVRFARSGRT